MSGSHSRFWAILLLGSYDPQTKNLLYQMKDRLSDNFMYHPDRFLFLVLDSLEVFIADVVSFSGTEKITMITEKYDDFKFTLYNVHESTIIDVEDLTISANLSIQDEIRLYLQKKYQESTFFKPTILDALRFIGSASSLVVILRDAEQTRGGEYIELVYLLLNNFPPHQVFVPKKEGLELSEMAWEILDYYGVNFRPYKDVESMVSRVTTVLKNIVKSYQ